MINVGLDINELFSNEAPGQKCSAIRWLQKKVMEAAKQLRYDFKTLQEWELFKKEMLIKLRQTIGFPEFPPMKNSLVRARFYIGNDVIGERVDVYVDDEYAIPTFIFIPRKNEAPFPALVWNPGWPQTKWDPAVQKLGARLAAKGIMVLVLDHAPFGETGIINIAPNFGMTSIMGAGHVLGISQLALRSAETIRCGEYLRSRPDVDPSKVAVAGLCQGGQDTWLSAALEERFCAAAPICSESTFALHFAEMANYQMNADSSPFPFGILKVCDIQHLHAAIAPRPLMVRANLGDNWWPMSGFDAVESFTRKIYRLYNAEDKVDFRAEVHEHNITGPFADALEEFLLKVFNKNP